MANPELENYVRSEERMAQDFLERNGYRKCDIPSCNCGSYHDWNIPTNQDARARLKQLKNALQGILDI